jgi:hypothetical protein
MDWYSFEKHGRIEVTVFDFEDVHARTGAKGTRFFRDQFDRHPDPKKLVREALRRMPEVRRRWPRKEWPQPYGLRADEDEIVLPALLLAAERPDDEVERVVKTG